MRIPISGHFVFLFYLVFSLGTFLRKISLSRFLHPPTFYQFSEKKKSARSMRVSIVVLTDL